MFLARHPAADFHRHTAGLGVEVTQDCRAHGESSPDQMPISTVGFPLTPDLCKQLECPCRPGEVETIVAESFATQCTQKNLCEAGPGASRQIDVMAVRERPHVLARFMISNALRAE